MSAESAARARPSPGDLGLSRRAVGSILGALAASTALVTSGCDADEPLDLPGLPPLGDDPDRERVLAGLRDERLVLERIARVRRRHRSLRRTLAPAEAVHRAHVGLLGRAGDDPDDPADAGDPGGGGAPGGVPVDPAQAVAQLVRLERDLAARHATTAMRARSGVLARVIASMSAAAAQQAVVLGSLEADAPGGRP